MRYRAHITTIDREALKRAFQRMSKHKIVARQNFKCCGGCGASALHTLIEERRARGHARGRGLQGGVFYHQQDTASMRDGGRCWLNYSAFEVDDKPVGLTTTQIGQLVLVALFAEGLHAEWDGNEDHSIVIHPHPITDETRQYPQPCM